MIAQITCKPLINWKQRGKFRCIGWNNRTVSVPKSNMKKINRQSAKVPLDISMRIISREIMIRFHVQPRIMLPDKVPYGVIRICPKDEGCMAGHNVVALGFNFFMIIILALKSSRAVIRKFTYIQKYEYVYIICTYA